MEVPNLMLEVWQVTETLEHYIGMGELNIKHYWNSEEDTSSASICIAGLYNQESLLGGAIHNQDLEFRIEKMTEIKEASIELKQPTVSSSVFEYTPVVNVFRRESKFADRYLNRSPTGTTQCI